MNMRVLIVRISIVLLCVGSLSALYGTNNLIMVLDKNKQETSYTNSRALVTETLSAMHSAVAPIIVSTNVFEVIVALQNIAGLDGLQKLRESMERSNDVRLVKGLAIVCFFEKNVLVKNSVTSVLSMLGKVLVKKGTKYFVKQHNDQDWQLLPLLSLINLNTDNWDVYLHKSADFVLLIPRNYVKSHFQQPLNADMAQRASLCGFDNDILKPVYDLSPQALLQQVQDHQKDSKGTGIFFDEELLSMVNKQQGKNKWIIHLVGHGMPALPVKLVRQDVKERERSLARLRSKKNNHNESLIKRFEQKTIDLNDSIYEAVRKDDKVVHSSGHISGMSAGEFSRLIAGLDEKLSIAYLNYSTCFAGGKNQEFVNDFLKSINASFIVSSQGINENVTAAIWPGLVVEENNGHKNVVIAHKPFTDFFNRAEMFIDNPRKMSTNESGPFSQILAPFVGSILENQPFVRIPRLGVFKAVEVDKHIVIITDGVLGESRKNNQPINVSETDKRSVLVYPLCMNVPLLLNKEKELPFIIFPFQKMKSVSDKFVHFFQEVDDKGVTINELLHQLLLYNINYYDQVIVIKKITGLVLHDIAEAVENSEYPFIKNMVLHIGRFKYGSRVPSLREYAMTNLLTRTSNVLDKIRNNYYANYMVHTMKKHVAFNTKVIADFGKNSLGMSFYDDFFQKIKGSSVALGTMASSVFVTLECKDKCYYASFLIKKGLDRQIWNQVRDVVFHEYTPDEKDMQRIADKVLPEQRGDEDNYSYTSIEEIIEKLNPCN